MTKQNFSHIAVARIAEYLDAADRESRYEKPLAGFLEERRIGRLKGASVQVDEKYKVVSVDLELELQDVAASLAAVQQEFERLGVPSGSEMRFLRNGIPVNRRMGVLEMVELTLNLSGLTQETMETFDFHAFYDDLNRSLQSEDAGQLRGVWSGPEETSIVICGRSAGDIRDALMKSLPFQPFLKGAKLQLRRKDPKAKTEEIRL